ncbi:hypothetical protein EBAPG3_004320 [Nitrosospira lacus]|uniref:Uncharacterized protein n=1 Tax=Nitrosospira lacus TaxID=1288494 RepID=A0A1W6SMM3_9PROT|nr:hypothetical protein EBAPG3_004320 [Nitrosospira lacus]
MMPASTKNRTGVLFSNLDVWFMVFLLYPVRQNNSTKHLPIEPQPCHHRVAFYDHANLARHPASLRTDAEIPEKKCV